MKIRPNFTSKEILEKEFSIDIKGYSTYDVDYFFDMIKKDYESWEALEREQKKIIDNFEKEKDELINKLKISENHIKKLRDEIKVLQSKSRGNIDIIQRLNKLEEKK